MFGYEYILKNIFIKVFDLIVKNIAIKNIIIEDGDSLIV